MALIAEALATRKDLSAESGTLQQRIAAAAIGYEDDESPEEDVDALISRLNQVLDEIRQLNVSLNETNNATALTFDGQKMTIMEAIALRESLHQRSRAHRAISDSAALNRGYYGTRTKDEVKRVVRIDAKKHRKQADDAANKARLLDLAIQRVNWTAELVG